MNWNKKFEQSDGEKIRQMELTILKENIIEEENKKLLLEGLIRGIENKKQKYLDGTLDIEDYKDRISGYIMVLNLRELEDNNIENLKKEFNILIH
jgi:hypothetical protein